MQTMLVVLIVLTLEPILESNAVHLPEPPNCGSTAFPHSNFQGAQPAELGHWPWSVALLYDLKGKPDWLCGGVLISERHVVTAALCLNQLGDLLKYVRLGDLDLNLSDDGATPIDMEIESYVFHSNYSFKNNLHDIGLIKLKRPVTFTSNIRPTCLPISSKIMNTSYEGLSAVVSGWGTVESGVNFMYHQQQVATTVIDNETCKRNYVNYAVIKDSHICAKTTVEGQGACGAFMGSSLALLRDKTYYTIGLSSFGKGCGRKDFPGVYTRLTEYIDWIDQNTE